MKAIDLFSGCGGLSLGFQNKGFEILSAFDNWLPAIDVYKENFDHNIFQLDLSGQDRCELISKFKDLDIIIGGPPCQDFSSAGLRDENRGKADLTKDFADIVCQIKPNWFLMENVERITKSGILPEIKNKFSESGYGLTQVVLDASYYNVPQIRKRFFLIGKLGETDNFLEEMLLAKKSNQRTTIRDYLGNSLGTEHYYRHPRSYARRGVFSIDEPSPTVRGVNRPIPKTYQFHEGDTSKNIDEIRPLTTIERSYIQTFPKDFKFKGSKTDLEQMIGNAVPVKLAEAVAETIINYNLKL